ncbi:hypothetical protein F9L00_16880 [Brucella anthropi]|nr:hypothetical protein F9K98_21045 [Brucella anthropi]KAB2775342.1 hypothetical protein F9L00_16880 [Brucella anthropi]
MHSTEGILVCTSWLILDHLKMGWVMRNSFVCAVAGMLFRQEDSSGFVKVNPSCFRHHGSMNKTMAAGT